MRIMRVDNMFHLRGMKNTSIGVGESMLMDFC